MSKFNFKDPNIPELARTPLVRPNGKKVWHDLTPTRFRTPLPPVQGPVRARADRASKDPNLVQIDPAGTPQLPSQSPPKRGKG